jgi:hypothetical protein
MVGERVQGLALEQTELHECAGFRPELDQGHAPQWLRIDYQADREEFVRSLSGLESINDMPAAEFWKDVANQ